MYQKYQKVPKYIKYTKIYPYVSQCFPMYPKANCKKYTKNWKALFDLVKVIIMVLYYGYMQYRFSIESKVKRNTIVLWIFNESATVRRYTAGNNIWAYPESNRWISSSGKRPPLADTNWFINVLYILSFLMTLFRVGLQV